MASNKWKEERIKAIKESVNKKIEEEKKDKCLICNALRSRCVC
jgi:hypothetical protein